MNRTEIQNACLHIQKCQKITRNNEFSDSIRLTFVQGYYGHFETLFETCVHDKFWFGTFG